MSSEKDLVGDNDWSSPCDISHEYGASQKRKLSSNNSEAQLSSTFRDRLKALLKRLYSNNKPFVSDGL